MSYKKDSLLEFCKRKKNILDKRKASWRNLFHKYSQPVSNQTEINLKTLMPEECNILENNISENKMSKNINFESIEKMQTDVIYQKDTNETCAKRVIWRISSTGILVVVINDASNRTINIKKQFVEDTNFVINNTKLQGSKQFCIRTQAFDSESD
ncbi:hypothetical protein KPH14_005362 [Odynerus spinipes]|uniref:Uncharacterized protein n=1 Tax=Odynerus spinipes TaxID=1348599 RepID=A0AAD9RBJ9_9HYME|nr:hypothetical protein KPH14_005362 [Odynerus spinipes]